MALSASRSDLVSSGSIVVSAPPGRDARSGAHGLGPPKPCLGSLVQADLLPRTAGAVKARHSVRASPTDRDDVRYRRPRWKRPRLSTVKMAGLSTVGREQMASAETGALKLRPRPGHRC